MNSSGGPPKGHAHEAGRFASFRVSMELVLEWCKEGAEVAFECASGVPDDATLDHVFLDGASWEKNTVVRVVYESESNDRLEPGDEIPVHDIEFKDLVE